MTTLADNRALRLTTLCMLYVAQGIPFGFISIALKNYLLGQEISLDQAGAILGYISLPFAVKAVWGPVMDRWGFLAMGRRRPWILFAQTALVLTLVGFAAAPATGALSIPMLAAMILLTNLFASMQDVAVDALAVDLLPENERGRVSALMYGSSYFGTFFGGWFVGFILFDFGIRAAFLTEAGLLALIMLLPLFLREREGEKRFPWSSGQAAASAESVSSLQQLLGLALRAFGNVRALAFAVFAILVHASGNALTLIRSNYFINERGWTDKDYSALESVWGVWFGMAGCLAGAVSGRIEARFRVAAASLILAAWWCWFAWREPGAFDSRTMLTAYLLGAEFIKAFLSVSMFAMFMAIAYKRVAATQFTAYMALLNVSLWLGNRFASDVQAFFGVQQAHLAGAVFQIAILGLLWLGSRPDFNPPLATAESRPR